MGAFFLFLKKSFAFLPALQWFIHSYPGAIVISRRIRAAAATAAVQHLSAQLGHSPQQQTSLGVIVIAVDKRCVHSRIRTLFTASCNLKCIITLSESPE